MSHLHLRAVQVLRAAGGRVGGGFRYVLAGLLNHRRHIETKCLRAVAFIAMTILLSSCSALDAFLATPAPFVPTDTPLPSPTYVWFPPSATPTPRVLLTQPPTPEMRPGLTGIALTDDLSDPSLWDTATSDQGSAQVKDNSLNLSVQSGYYITSLKHELALNDFYVEITARPGLCREDDTYGLLVRANAVAYYRFSLSCNGMVSADRTSLRTHELLHAPVPSGDVPPGAPGEVRIGVWAVGTEMRLFLNDHYQFAITDSNYAGGTVGVFVNSAGNTATVVSFSDLIVQGVNYTPPIATSTPKP